MYLEVAMASSHSAEYGVYSNSGIKPGWWHPPISLKPLLS